MCTTKIMEVIDTIPLQLASILIFIGSLAVGYILLMLRDFMFGNDVGTKGDHHIDFNKKIEEEEELNLNVLGRSSKKLNTESITSYNSTGHSEAKEPTGRYNHKMSGSNSNNLAGKES